MKICHTVSSTAVVKECQRNFDSLSIHLQINIGTVSFLVKFILSENSFALRLSEITTDAD